MKSLSIALAAAAVIASTAAFAETVDAMAECKTMSVAYMAAYNKGDAGAVAGMYGKDAIFSSPFWSATSRDAIEGGYKAELAGGTKYTQIGCAHSTNVGEVGYADGPWEALAKAPDGKEMRVGGHYAVVVRREGGKYVFVSHTANMQLPSAPTH